jgi:hypothetical protein
VLDTPMAKTFPAMSADASATTTIPHFFKAQPPAVSLEDDLAPGRPRT